jgi:hypothetical protein
MHSLPFHPENGRITREQFKKFLEDLGDEWLMAQLLRVIDKNGNGIDFFEFMNWLYLTEFTTND